MVCRFPFPVLFVGTTTWPEYICWRILPYIFFLDQNERFVIRRKSLECGMPLFWRDIIKECLSLNCDIEYHSLISVALISDILHDIFCQFERWWGWGDSMGKFINRCLIPDVYLKMTINDNDNNNNDDDDDDGVPETQLGPEVRVLIASFMGPTWGPAGANRTQVGPMLAQWTMLSE